MDDLLWRFLPRVRLPEPLEYLWDWFSEMDRTRASDMNGPLPLSYPTIDAWARLTARSPSPAEVELLLQIDLVVRQPDAWKESPEEVVHG
jgi:hypothetical protein